MKLKKIASLMLAGVMAVSMLTACGEANNIDDTQKPNDDETVVSNYATELRSMMDGDARKKVEAVANADLDAALKNAVDVYFNNQGFNDVGQYGVVLKEASDSKVAKSLTDALGAKTVITELDDDNDKVTTAVKLYVVNASISDTYALEQVAEKIQNSIGNLPRHSDDTADGEEYNYSYTISASIVNKPITSSIIDGIGSGIKYVAVSVTQTPTHVA